MSPAEIETALRECLKRRAVLAPPCAQEVADAAIRRAWAVRQRQAGAGALVAVVVVAVVGVWLLRPVTTVAPSTARFVAQNSAPPWSAATSTSSTVSPYDPGRPPHGSVRDELLREQTLPVDVVVADRLLTATGTVDLSAVGPVAGAYRVTGGWLVVALRRAGEASLWFVRRSGSPRALLDRADTIIVAPDGDRVAWREGAEVHLGTMTGDRLSRVDDTPAPVGALPVGFVGDGVLVVRRPAEALAGSYAVWRPGQAELPVTWRTATGVYGALPDGRTVVAQVDSGDGEPCLALLDAVAQLAVRDQACDVPLTTGADGWLSPDGRWLVAERTPAEAVLVDVTSVFGGHEPAVGAGPRPNGPGAWTGTSTVVYGGEGYLARLHLDWAADGKPEAVERIILRGFADRPVLVVPTLPVGTPATGTVG